MLMRRLLVTILYMALAAFALAAGRAEPITLDVQEGRFYVNQASLQGEQTLVINGAESKLVFEQGRALIEFEASRRGSLVSLRASEGPLVLYHQALNKDGSIRLIKIPLWLSIVPPLLAILLALMFKEVIISLFVGIWSGSFIAGGLRIDSLYYFFESFVKVVEKYIIEALADSGHLSVIIFSLLIGGMVGIISRNGGMAGVVKSLSHYAKSAVSAQFTTWLLGVAIFFDDYANTLIVGNTMRSVTDRFRISREKLAYIVDSTAAPVAAIAFITTWIGAELGYIDGGLAMLSTFPFEVTPYAIFVSSLKYAFYPMLALAFILMLVYTRRDFGPMHAAELRARSQGQVKSDAQVADDEPNKEDLTPVPNAPLKWQHAFFPVITVILMTILGLVVTGMTALHDELLGLGRTSSAESWSATWSGMNSLFPEGDAGFFRKIGKLIGASDSYVSLLWASLSGVVVAIAITIYRKIMSVIDTMHTMITGFKTMMPALIILALAWSLAITTQQLQTATFLSSALAGNINPYLMPPLIFVLAALIAFSTGSSWSTMAILYPIAIPTMWVVAQSAGIADDTSLELLLNVISIVLGASVLGDHCSPISDTTILSSLASDCNHIDHVRTQMPYALVVGSVALISGTLSTFLGGGWMLSFTLLLVSLGVLYLVVKRWGKPVPDYTE